MAGTRRELWVTSQGLVTDTCTFVYHIDGKKPLVALQPEVPSIPLDVNVYAIAFTGLGTEEEIRTRRVFKRIVDMSGI